MLGVQENVNSCNLRLRRFQVIFTYVFVLLYIIIISTILKSFSKNKCFTFIETVKH